MAKSNGHINAKYLVTIEKSKYGYHIECPALPGCVSQGDSLHEAMQNIKDAIRTYHMGFVRDKRKKTEHIIRIQEKVFDLGLHDPRTDADIKENEGKFRPYTRFSKEDMLPIYENLPKVIQKWAKERDVE